MTNNSIDLNSFSPELHILIEFLAQAKKLDELKELTVCIPGTKEQIQFMETSIGKVYFSLPLEIQRLVSDLRQIPKCSFFWLDWLEERHLKCPLETPLLRYIFSNSGHEPFGWSGTWHITYDDEIAARLNQLPPAANPNLSDHWWHHLSSPISLCNFGGSC